MLARHIFALAATLGAVSAAIPDLDKHKKPHTESSSEPGHQSLPDLLQINDIRDLELTWETNNLRYDTGRLLLEQGSGSLWSIAQLANSVDEWTAELTFRSTGQAAQDAQFEDNGLSLWFVDPENSPSLMRDTSNFGGPATYDGFQILVNNRDSPGLRIFMNDGTVARLNMLSDSIGNCGFKYLDSNIPFTVRVSYSKLQKWFKVQVDNNLCFKTDSVVIPNTMNDFKFGVTGNLDPRSLETFELLKLSVWSTLTEDAIDDHGLMSDGKLSVQYKTVVVGENDHVPPSKIRESLMERNRRHQQLILEEQRRERQGSDSNNGLDVDTFLQDIVARLDTIDKTIGALNAKQDTTGGNYGGQASPADNANLEKLQDDLRNFEATITKQFTNMVDALSSLNQKVIGEVREHQHGMDELSRKVDLLMANHKEIAHQYNEQIQVPPSAELTTTIVRWVLTPVVLCIVVLSVFIYRLRHDIKHSKLL